MTGPVAIESLHVIGYADVLSSTVLPSIVPPIFALNADPDHVLLPPYHLIGDSVWNAHRVTRAEADALQSAHELTFLPDPIPARVGYQMFVDLQFRTDYLPQDSVD